MLKILKDRFPPSDPYKIGDNKGNGRWVLATQKVLKEYKQNANQFTSGDYKFPAHPSANKWKKELKIIQGEKCCYCEKSINNGELEHFRPKNGWQQNKGDSLYQPGYYWLAYKWDNILLSCGECNEQGTKGNLFPISDTNDRCYTPTSKLPLEDPMLINPYLEDPSEHISFYKSTPIVVNNSLKGKTTIDILKLKNRPDLVTQREEKFRLYSLLHKIINIPSILSLEEKKYAKQLVKRVQKGKESYAGMILENIKNGHLK